MRHLILAAIALSTTAATALDIPDRDLRSAISGALGIPAVELTADDLAGLVHLDPGDKLVTDLTGLQHAVNLETAVLDDNQLSDLSALTGLTKLRVLDLHDNRVTDLSVLAGLTALEVLILGDNRITDFSPLTKLPNLKTLILDENHISTIPDLSGLTSIEVLDLSRNPIIPTSPEVLAAQRELESRGATLVLTGLLPTPTAPQLTVVRDTDTLSLSWPSELDLSYRVQFSEDLATWQSVTSSLDGNGATMVISLPLPAAKQGFFQVLATRNP